MLWVLARDSLTEAPEEVREPSPQGLSGERGCTSTPISEAKPLVSPALPHTHPFQTGCSLGAPSHTAGCSCGPDLEAGEAPWSAGCPQRVWTPPFQGGLVKWWVSEQEGVSESIYRRTFLTPAKTQKSQCPSFLWTLSCLDVSLEQQQPSCDHKGTSVRSELSWERGSSKRKEWRTLVMPLSWQWCLPGIPPPPCLQTSV